MKLIDADKRKGNDAQRERHAIVRSRGTQSQKSRQIAHQDEYEYGADVISEISTVLAHSTVYHAVEELYYQLNEILKSLRHLIGMLHLAPRKEAEHHK